MSVKDNYEKEKEKEIYFRIFWFVFLSFVSIQSIFFLLVFSQNVQNESLFCCVTILNKHNITTKLV